MIEKDLLRAELERLFELEELLHLSRNLLGFEPETLGGTETKASFAGALAAHCETEDAVEALCDAMLALRLDASPDLVELRASGLKKDEPLAIGSAFGPFVIARELGEGR